MMPPPPAGLLRRPPPATIEPASEAAGWPPGRFSGAGGDRRLGDSWSATVATALSAK